MQERVVQRVDRRIRRQATTIAHRVEHELVGADTAAEVAQKHERPVVRRAVLGLGAVAHEHDEGVVEHRAGILGCGPQSLQQRRRPFRHVPARHRQNLPAGQVQCLVRVVVPQLVRGHLGYARVSAANRAQLRRDGHH
ncbi:MAG: hypothetical protein ACK55I_09335, partial [bacterium]